MAITLVTQYDIHLVHAIEEEISEWGSVPAARRFLFHVCQRLGKEQEQLNP